MLYGGTKWNETDFLNHVMMKIYFEVKFIKLFLPVLNKMKGGKLAKVSKDGNTLEFVCKSDKYPAEIDKNEPDYCINLRASID